MPYSAKVKKGPNGWVAARFQGVNETRNAEYVQARFVALESGELVTMPMEVPFRYRDVASLFRACGKELNNAEEIELPYHDESDKMGLDEIVEVNVQEKNGYYNVQAVREAQGIS